MVNVVKRMSAERCREEFRSMLICSRLAGIPFARRRFSLQAPNGIRSSPMTSGRGRKMYEMMPIYAGAFF